MTKHGKHLIVIAAVCLLALVGCSSQGASSGSASAASAASSASASASSSASAASASTSTASASSDMVAVGNEDTVEISLERNAGTGYEWKCTIEPEGVISQHYKEAKGEQSSQATAGGPVTDVFTLKAAGAGEAIVTFNLVREWEDKPAETQVYAFTVDSNLKMTLNPYKSDFDKEPVWWGSNS